jgi:hypothetical protein
MPPTKKAARLRPPATLTTLALACLSLAACGDSSGPASPHASAPSAGAVASVPAAASTKPPAGAALATARAHLRRARASLRKGTTTPRPSTPSSAGSPSAARSAASQARLRAAFASLTRCMRKNGIDVPEPGVKRTHASKPIDTKTPQFKTAFASCRNLLTAALRSARPATKPKGPG